jgi:hypothetical protein
MDTISLSPDRIPGEDVIFSVPERREDTDGVVNDSLPFSVEQLTTALYGVLQSPHPHSMDTEHLNLHVLRMSDQRLWSRPGLAHLLRRILRHREELYEGLRTSETVGEVKASCSFFKHRVLCWLESLEVAVMKVDGVTRRVRKATQLHLKRRAAGLTYQQTLDDLGRSPTVTNLMKVRRSLKELWYILNIAKE